MVHAAAKLVSLSRSAKCIVRVRLPKGGTQTQASSPLPMYDVAACLQRSQAKPLAFRQIAYTKRTLTEEERQRERENQEALRLASLEIKDRRPSLLSLHCTKVSLLWRLLLRCRKHTFVPLPLDAQ